MKLRKFLFTVTTSSGIKFHIEAANIHEARARASDPAIGKYLAHMMIAAVSNIEKVVFLEQRENHLR